MSLEKYCTGIIDQRFSLSLLPALYEFHQKYYAIFFNQQIKVTLAQLIYALIYPRTDGSMKIDCLKSSNEKQSTKRDQFFCRA